jgi:membrane associated rhomboid family serine protease
VFLGFFYQLINVPALVVLVLWFGLQLLSGFMSLGAGSAVDAGVAVFAHIGGFVAGVVVGLIVRGGGARRRRDTRPGRFGVG